MRWRVVTRCVCLSGEGAAIGVVVQSGVDVIFVEHWTIVVASSGGGELAVVAALTQSPVLLVLSLILTRPGVLLRWACPTIHMWRLQIAGAAHVA